jgi:hypothetical protein
MADDSTKTEKQNTLKLKIATPREKGVREDDRPRAILYTDNVEMDTLLYIDAAYNRMSIECANRLGCKIEHIPIKIVSSDCGRIILGKTDIEIEIVGLKEYLREDFYVLENMDEDIILGLSTIRHLRMENFFTSPLRCDTYVTEYICDNDNHDDEYCDFCDDYLFESNEFGRREDESEEEEIKEC